MGDPAPSTPKWVRVFVIVAAAIALLAVVLFMSGQGHGPGRHFGGDAPAHKR